MTNHSGPSQVVFLNTVSVYELTMLHTLMQVWIKYPRDTHINNLVNILQKNKILWLSRIS